MRIPEDNLTLVKYLQCIDILISDAANYKDSKIIQSFLSNQRHQLYNEFTKRRENEKNWEKNSIFYGDVIELMEKEKITYKEANERITNEKNMHNN